MVLSNKKFVKTKYKVSFLMQIWSIKICFTRPHSGWGGDGQWGWWWIASTWSQIAAQRSCRKQKWIHAERFWSIQSTWNTAFLCPPNNRQTVRLSNQPQPQDFWRDRLILQEQLWVVSYLPRGNRNHYKKSPKISFALCYTLHPFIFLPLFISVSVSTIVNPQLLLFCVTFTYAWI